ncbi:ATP-dependent helicase, partial [Paraburkholderia aspalathi]|nr:ATP-dependent helicase [Paraburkholderia aspalathi]
ADTMPAPGIAAVQAKNNERILNEVMQDEVLDDEHQDLLKALQERYTPEQIAGAYLRRELSLRPVPEELSDAPIRPFEARKPNERNDRFDKGDRGGERAPREDRFRDSGSSDRGDRGPRFDGVWFSLSAGRKHRADPKWLLPLICKAGGVTKREVGSIRIHDNETRFEIITDKAGEFFSSVQERGTGEKGLVIREAKDGGGASSPRPADDGDFKPRTFKPKGGFGDKSNAGPKGGAPKWDKPKPPFRKKPGSE